MNKKMKHDLEAGFSLIELMIVVGIIGILATLAIPRFSEFQAKARMAEARNTLQHIYTLEQTYHLDNGQYVNISPVGADANAATGNNNRNCQNSALGLSIQPCNDLQPRYAYEVVRASPTAFLARAMTGDGDNNRVCTSSGSNGSHAFYMNEARELRFSQTHNASSMPANAPIACGAP